MAFDYELGKILETYIKGKIYKKGYQWLMLCPFHNDTKQSLSVNMEEPPNNKGFICFGCNKKGSRETLIKDLTGKSSSSKERERLLFDNKRKRLLETRRMEKKENKLIPDKFIPDSVVANYHERLLQEAKPLSILFKKRLLNCQSIDRFKIGWDGQRIIIPIFDEKGRCCNLRKYHWWKKEKIISEVGFGSAKLY